MGTVELGHGLPGGQEKLERSLELELAADIGHEVGRAYNNLAFSLAPSSEIERRRPRDHPGGSRSAGSVASRAHLNNLLATRALSELARGRWNGAAETATSILEVPESRSETAAGGPVDTRLVRARRGDPDYQPLLDNTSELAAPVGDLDWVVTHRSGAGAPASRRTPADTKKLYRRQVGGDWEGAARE